MYGSVHFHVGKVRMILKVIALAVFQNEYPVGGKQVSFKNKVRYLCNVLQLIGWICKYEIKLCVAVGYVFEYVTLYRNAFVCLDSFHHLADETVMSRVVLNAYHMGAAS